MHGWSTLGNTMYSGAARPRNKAQWAQFTSAIEGALLGAPDWWKTLEIWLQEVALRAGGSDVRAQIYNPGDLIQSIVHGIDNKMLERLVPRIELLVESKPPHGKYVCGFLAWDGTNIDIVEALKTVYPDGGAWSDARWAGRVWESDQKLLKAWHLRYIVHEVTGPESAPSQVERQGGELVRQIGRIDMIGRLVFPCSRPLTEFFTHYESELRVIAGKLRSNLLIDAGSAVQMYAHSKKNPVTWT